MLVLAAFLIVVVAVFVTVGNRRYLGHRPTEWMTNGQRLSVWAIVMVAVAILWVRFR